MEGKSKANFRDGDDWLSLELAWSGCSLGAQDRQLWSGNEGEKPRNRFDLSSDGIFLF